MDRYPYVFDTNATTIEVKQGGTPGPMYSVGDGLYAVDIDLAVPLAAGDTASLEYESTFRYAEPPPCELRRGVRRVAQNITLRVEFHPRRLPAQVWAASWRSLDATPILVEEVFLDTEHSAHRFYDTVENQIVGFTWSWT